MYSLVCTLQVGLIIGRGGESIKDLQNKAGCRMQMIQEGIYANAPEKPLKMIGSPQAILKAKVNYQALNLSINVSDIDEMHDFLYEFCHIMIFYNTYKVNGTI